MKEVMGRTFMILSRIRNALRTVMGKNNLKCPLERPVLPWDNNVKLMLMGYVVIV
jgi:hypothetical protein